MADPDPPMETVKPTPTQEENDLARMGQQVLEKEWDGSTVVSSAFFNIGGSDGK